MNASCVIPVYGGQTRHCVIPELFTAAEQFCEAHWAAGHDFLCFVWREAVGANCAAELVTFFNPRQCEPALDASSWVFGVD
jgi:hypothetical protein